MSTPKDLAQLAACIAAQHGWPAARAFKAYAMSEADQAVVSRSAIDLLRLFPAAAIAPTIMSAALAVSLESRMKAPIHVVTGTLYVEGQAVEGLAVQGLEAHGANPTGQAYAWVMIGPYVVDIALFRNAYSREGSPRLSRHVDLAFGPGKALYVDLWKRTAKRGLRYEPRHVLSEEDVTRAMGDAYGLITQGAAATS